MHWTDRRQRFRQLLAGNQCIHPGSVFDPISARIAEELGFEVGMFAGSIASFTVLGAPDLIVLTLSEFADQAYRINRAGKLPLLVDADHGYGNALNVMRTVQELETAGVAAMCIEDTLLPRAYGEKQPSLISLEEGVGKMRAALAAREDPSFVIVGRTSAAAISGTEDVVRRAKAYAEAGVDALFFAGGMTREQLDALSSAVSIPLMLGGSGRELQDREYLASRRVRIALQGHQPFSAAVLAVYNTLKALREGTKPGDLPNIASADMMKRVTREGDYKSWTEKFLGG
ncbi:MAG TPA: isocitrate lyase/phosphoenolpyruvate mutase family protein [Acetobacteraceae bacterium]|nr:isocitrate lyase/phosphoenolpyruvate mutase family protein [Acetobacteraceae bacterium]